MLMRDPRRLAALAVVGGLYFSLGMGLDMLLALLPAVAAAFAVSSAGVIWVSTARSSSRFVSPVLGRLSDRIGRKIVLLPCLVAFSLGNLGSAAAPSFGWLIVTQGLAGLGLTGLQVILPAYLGDLFPYHVRGRVIGTLTIFAAAGTMLGVPTAAFLAQALGVRASFMALGVLAGVLACLALVLLATPARPEGQRDAAPEAAWHNPLRHASVRAALVVTLCWLMMMAALYSFLAAWLQQALSFTTSQIGLTFAMMGGASVVANLLVASFSDRLGKRRVMLAGLSLGTASLVPLALLTHGWMLLGAVVFFVLTNELGFGAYGVLITELVPAQRGMVLSLHMLAWGLGVTVGPPLASLLWQAGGFPRLALSMTLAGAVGFLVALFYLARPAAPALRPASGGLGMD